MLPIFNGDRDNQQISYKMLQKRTVTSIG